jgi:hypothetical protein
MDKNIVWAGRNAAYLAMKTFLNKVKLLGEKTSDLEDSFE